MELLGAIETPHFLAEVLTRTILRNRLSFPEKICLDTRLTLYGGLAGGGSRAESGKQMCCEFGDESWKCDHSIMTIVAKSEVAR